MKIELDLTEGQWCELANAVATKAATVRRGDYDVLDDDGHDRDAWAAELDAIYAHIAARLEELGMEY